MMNCKDYIINLFRITNTILNEKIAHISIISKYLYKQVKDTKESMKQNKTAFKNLLIGWARSHFVFTSLLQSVQILSR